LIILFQKLLILLGLIGKILEK